MGRLIAMIIYQSSPYQSDGQYDLLVDRINFQYSTRRYLERVAPVASAAQAQDLQSIPH